VGIDVPGPLVARQEGGSVVPTAAKPRKVLAMLTVHADQVVPMASLFEVSEALAIWRGRALVDVQTGPLLEVESHRLEEARLDVLDRRIDADLRLGRHHELLGELAGLVGRYRTHEGLHAHLMLALYRSGRRGEAIDVYRRMRTGLVNELGLEPSPSLRRLQHAILMSDRRLTEYGSEAVLERAG
jgi:SARP family transcriptional regulator, regulator of embCAB operon